MQLYSGEVSTRQEVAPFQGRAGVGTAHPVGSSGRRVHRALRGGNHGGSGCSTSVSHGECGDYGDMIGYIHGLGLRRAMEQIGYISGLGLRRATEYIGVIGFSSDVVRLAAI